MTCDDSSYRDLTGADGRRRRRTALAVIAAAVLAGAAGMWIGSRIESPADRAAARQAPTPSLVTVPVESRQLTSEVVLSGEVAYNEPLMVTLGRSGRPRARRDGGRDRAARGRYRAAGGRRAGRGHDPPGVRAAGRAPDVPADGDRHRRPRRGPARTRPRAVGYDPGTVDTVFDAATAAAVEQMYADAAYAAEGPSDEQRTELTTAREAVTSAQRGVADAQKALAKPSSRCPSRSDCSSSRRSTALGRRCPMPRRRRQAGTRRAGPAGRQRPGRPRHGPHGPRRGGDRPRCGQRRPARSTPTPASPTRRSGSPPSTSPPPRPRRPTPRPRASSSIAEQARTRRWPPPTPRSTTPRVQLQIAEAQLAEGTAAGDTGPLQEAVTAAETAARRRPRPSWPSWRRSAGTRISPGEIVFAPVLPATLTEAYVALGSAVDGPVGMLATTDTLVRARVARADAGVVAVGSRGRDRDPRRRRHRAGRRC